MNSSTQAVTQTKFGRFKREPASHNAKSAARNLTKIKISPRVINALLGVLPTISASIYAVIAWLVLCEVPITQSVPPLLTPSPLEHKVWAPIWLAPALAALLVFVFDSGLRKLPIGLSQLSAMLTETARLVIAGSSAWFIFSLISLLNLPPSMNIEGWTVLGPAMPLLIALSVTKFLKTALAFAVWLLFLASAFAFTHRLLQRTTASSANKDTSVLRRRLRIFSTTIFALIMGAFQTESVSKLMDWEVSMGGTLAISKHVILVVNFVALSGIAAGLWWFFCMPHGRISISGIHCAAAIITAIRTIAMLELNGIESGHDFSFALSVQLLALNTAVPILFALLAFASVTGAITRALEQFYGRV